MKKLLAIAVFLMIGLISCNSGNNSETTTSTDSTKMATDTSSSMNSMNMSTEANMPEVPAGAKVYFKNLKDGETVSSP
ncbi:MAG: hypothetical protein ACTHNG_02985, partial [Ginsengibacter sp.]